MSNHKRQHLHAATMVIMLTFEYLLNLAPFAQQNHKACLTELLRNHTLMADNPINNWYGFLSCLPSCGQYMLNVTQQTGCSVCISLTKVLVFVVVS